MYVREDEQMPLLLGNLVVSVLHKDNKRGGAKIALLLFDIKKLLLAKQEVFLSLLQVVQCPSFLIL
jgi:hypothetical protein